MNNNAEICEFIHHLFGTQDFVPLSAPKFIGNEKKYLNECIDTTFVSSVGAFVDRFEHDMAVYTGAKRAVVCVSGTNALHMAMLLVGVERDDEVLTQALTFIATCNAVSYIGAYPVFIDVDKETMGLSPRAVKAWLERNAELKEGVCYNKRTGRRVKACIPMHTFGHPVKIDELADICREWHIELVEDAAESIGSFIKVAIPVHSERWVLLALMETKPSLQVVEACCFSRMKNWAHTPSTLLPRLRYLIVGSFVMTILVIITGCRISMPL